MEKINLTHLSKVMAHALRHKPWVYELELDDEGWTPLADLLAALQQHRDNWAELTPAHLQAAIDAADKRRYEIQG
ncbi:MAG: RNA 2'-phosphotransferase, partial [Anaerolineae bacterium]|nr:RNA 2'-phosphotransferase [Anaerolineae bacterium]